MAPGGARLLEVVAVDGSHKGGCSSQWKLLAAAASRAEKQATVWEGENPAAVGTCGGR